MELNVNWMGECKKIDVPEECIIYNSIDILSTVKWLMDNFHFVTMVDTDEIYFYNNGVYKPHGEKLINMILEEAFGKIDIRGRLILSEQIKNRIRLKIRDSTYVNRDQFDNDKNIINMKNGLYKISEKTLIAHTPKYLSMIQIPVMYNSAADCVSIKKSFSAAIEKNDIIKILEFIGYCLYNGYPIQKAFILYGPGESGKSFIMMIIRSFLGSENCSTVSLHDIGNDRFATSDMYGKLLNLCGDLDSGMLKNLGTFKQATSGFEPIRAQQKGLPAFDFVNSAKLMFGTNKLSRSADESSGFFRRIETIIMKKLDPREIPHLPKKEDVLSDAELSGLFNWVIDTLPELLSRRRFTNQTNLEDAILQYKIASNPIESFVNDVLEESADMRISKIEMYKEFENYCRRNNVFDIPNRTKFWIVIRKIIPDMEIRTVRNGSMVERCVLGYYVRKDAFDMASI